MMAIKLNVVSSERRWTLKSLGMISRNYIKWAYTIWVCSTISVSQSIKKAESDGTLNE